MHLKQMLKSEGHPPACCTFCFAIDEHTKQTDDDNRDTCFKPRPIFKSLFLRQSKPFCCAMITRFCIPKPSRIDTSLLYLSWSDTPLRTIPMHNYAMILRIIDSTICKRPPLWFICAYLPSHRLLVCRNEMMAQSQWCYHLICSDQPTAAVALCWRVGLPQWYVPRQKCQVQCRHTMCLQ